MPLWAMYSIDTPIAIRVNMNVKLQHTNTHATLGHVVYRHPHRNQSQHECQTTDTKTHATLGHVVYRHPHRNQSQHECQTTTQKHTCHSGPCSLTTPPSQSEST